MDDQNNRLRSSLRDQSPHTSSWSSSTLRHLRSHPAEGPIANHNGPGCYDPLVPIVSASPINEHSTLQSLSARKPAAFYEKNTTHELPPPRSTTIAWAFELLALTMCVASIVAIVAILIRQNHKPVVAWKFRYTLNTVIAALGTVARTTLAFAMSACIGQQKWSWLRRRPDSIRAFERFDEASRGPWGGTRLFVWLRFRHWAALGALVTVGTVAFDPFLQAVLSTYGQLDNTNTSSIPTIGQAWRADGGEIVSMPGGAMVALNTSVGMLGTTPTASRPDFGIVSSIYQGFSNTSTPYDNTVSFDCATGNCTWSTFVSAAVCNSCKDVSEEIAFKTYWGENNGSSVPQFLNTAENTTFTSYTLPYSEIRNWNGYSDIVDDDWWNYTMGNVEGRSRTLLTVNTTYNAWRTIRHSELQTMLMAFAVIKAPDNWIHSNIPWESAHVIATECALYFCANAYQARSQSGILEEDIIGSWAVRDRDSYAINPAGSIRPEHVEQGPQTWAPWLETNTTDLYEPIDSNDLLRYDLRMLIPSGQSEGFPSSMTREVNVSHALIRSTIEYLLQFTGRSQDDLIQGISMGDGSYLLPQAYPDISAPPVVDVLWNSTNLTATFENVARSITNQLRNTSPQRHEGVVQIWVIHVRVDWAYLAYPITMLLIGILYVILTMVESMHLRLPVWKEKALPTLLYGFNDEMQRLLRERQGYGRAKKEDTVVQFTYNGEEDCLRLIAH